MAEEIKTRILGTTSTIPVDIENNSSEVPTCANHQTRDAFLQAEIEAEVERATTREDELEAEIQAAGKIDDVKVDGVSVVTNKVANIVLQPKLDALETKIPIITKGSTDYKFKIRVVNNKPQLVFEEI